MIIHPDLTKYYMEALMNTEIKEMLETYKRLHRELDEGGGPEENGELFETVIGLEDDILQGMDLPPAQKFREILWGENVDDVAASLESARGEYVDRPIKDPVLMLVDAILNKKDDPCNLLPMAGFTVHMYQLFMFSEKLLYASGPRNTDEIISEMRQAEAYLGELGILGIEGIKKHADTYWMLRGAGMESLDEYLIHNDKFDLDDADMDARHFFFRGMRHFQKERIDEAIIDFTSSLWLKPDMAIVAYNRGLAFEKLGHPQRAVEDYSYAILSDPGNYYALCNRGIILLQEGFGDRAMDDFSRAISVRPDGPVAYCNRGITLAVLEDHGRAVEDFTMALLMDPDDADNLYNRGVSYYRLGREDKALEDLEKSAGMGFEKAKEALEVFFKTGHDSGE
jgi:tetratricopeptide (TPR) repeat protein